MLSADDTPHRSDTLPPSVLCFHKVTPRLTFGSTNYSPDRLRRLFGRLQNEGYSFADCSRGEARSDDRCLLITFDDAYAHLVDSLPPLMREFNFRPMIFVPTGWIGRLNRWDYSHRLRSERHLNLMEIRELRDIGVCFGSHGHRHADLVGLSDDLLRDELVQSKTLLEEAVGTAIDTISYPFGRVDGRVAGAARKAGFTSGFTMCYPKPSDRPLQRGRYPVYFYDTPASVRRKLGSGFGRRLEKARAGLTNRLSYGTILLNRLKRNDDSIE